jgi:predicted methyltransferase
MLEKQIELVCGDCVDLMKAMPNAVIDLTVTSPPYDNLRTYNGYCFRFEEVAQELYRVTKQGGVVGKHVHHIGRGRDRLALTDAEQQNHGAHV